VMAERLASRTNLVQRPGVDREVAGAHSLYARDVLTVEQHERSRAAGRGGVLLGRQPGTPGRVRVDVTATRQEQARCHIDTITSALSSGRKPQNGQCRRQDGGGTAAGHQWPTRRECGPLTRPCANPGTRARDQRAESPVLTRPRRHPPGHLASVGGVSCRWLVLARGSCGAGTHRFSCTGSMSAFAGHSSRGVREGLGQVRT
jgi:hypothetical protein